ncbi:hypothetical protein DFH08DRAFT_993660 [Mycena albidolilacea]|uniref:Uncharacterized protein n=1 Tax=Mycena albidolilacea TaxID=1033008 RepID=A0AAD6YYE9_9AGAR|nr:hypothetical protein DFH08DRAFT_993660 [Mycena albidolilacea]
MKVREFKGDATPIQLVPRYVVHQTVIRQHSAAGDPLPHNLSNAAASKKASGRASRNSKPQGYMNFSVVWVPNSPDPSVTRIWLFDLGPSRREPQIVEPGCNSSSTLLISKAFVLSAEPAMEIEPQRLIVDNNTRTVRIHANSLVERIQDIRGSCLLDSGPGVTLEEAGGRHPRFLRHYCRANSPSTSRTECAETYGTKFVDQAEAEVVFVAQMRIGCREIWTGGHDRYEARTAGGGSRLRTEIAGCRSTIQGLNISVDSSSSSPVGQERPSTLL